MYQYWFISCNKFTILMPDIKKNVLHEDTNALSLLLAKCIYCIVIPFLGMWRGIYHSYKNIRAEYISKRSEQTFGSSNKENLCGVIFFLCVHIFSSSFNLTYFLIKEMPVYHIRIIQRNRNPLLIMPLC